MSKPLVVVACLFSTIALAAGPDDPRDFGAKQARVYRGVPGAALTPPATGSRVATVHKFLRDRGVDAATVGSMVTVSERRSGAGITHLRIEQVVGGLRVAGAYARAAVNDRGELVHLIEALAPVGSQRVAPARRSEREALAAALARVHPGVGTPPEAGRQGNTTRFARTGFFYAEPQVERVAIATEGAGLKTGFLVETWSRKDNLLHETLVSGEGRVLSVELRTANDRYNIFPVQPDRTPQQVVRGPGDGNAESPEGWLFDVTQLTTNISGNNVHAYLDTDNDGAADPGGAVVRNGNFLTAADLTVSPSSDANRAVAVQNLFYLNNVIHDALLRYGFTEEAGNFQETNFTGSGRGGDSVNAEAQDGGGTDNANFATPQDGKNPRMQMYLWSGKGDRQLVVHSPSTIAGTYRAQSTTWGGTLSPTGITADLVLVNDGGGVSPSDACEALAPNSLTGKLALIDRGSCDFVVKARNAEAAGALVAIIANNQGDSLITMGGDGTGITIPAIFIARTDGNTLKSGLASSAVNATARKTDPPPLLRDGDLDSDIVWHEYGHGLTWRMIGRMSGPLAGAIGEGMSDVLAIVVNDQDTVGEYSFDDPLGIRSAPYTNYRRTYGDVAGTGVHFDGEVYAAINWRLWKSFQSAGLGKDVLLGYLVDGMNYTPAQPSYEEMRDGILQAAAGTGRECLVWDAFAHYGVGEGAIGVAHGSRVIVSESFAVPASCSAVATP